MFPPPQQLPSQSSVPNANPLAAQPILLGGPGQRVASDQDFKPPKPNRRKGAQPGNQNARKHKLEIKQPDFSLLIPPQRKSGAQPGNQNAKTHGFYARRLPQSHLEGLENTTVRSLEDEIEVMRVFSRKVAELGAEVDDLDEAKSLLNTLANATGSINRLVRTHTHIPDPTLDPQWMLRHALEELEEEWTELKQFGDQFRTPEEIAELDARIAARQARELAERQAGSFNPEIPDPTDGKH